MVYEKKDKIKGWFGRAPKDEDSVDVKDTRTKIDAALLHDIVPQVKILRSCLLFLVLTIHLTKYSAFFRDYSLVEITSL